MARDQASFVQFFVSRARAGLWVLMLIATLFAHVHASAQDNFKPLVQEAFELHQHGQFSAALPLLRRAYAMQPDDYFVNLLLGIDSLRTGDPQASVRYLKKASRLRPHEEFPLAYLGEAYALQEIFGEAAAAYMKAVSVAPTSAESSIAFVDFALSRFANISTSLRSSTKGLAAEYRLRALAVGENGAERVSLLQRSADLDPAAPGIWSDLGRASLAAGNVAAAEDAARRAVEANPNDLAAWMLDAQLAAQSHDWKRVQTRLNAIAQRSAETLSLETARWPKQIQAPAGAVSGVAAKFLSCVQEGKTACEFPVSRSGSTDPSVLFREQRWEQLTKLPASRDGESKAWIQRGIAFASLDDCARAIPSLERGLTASSTDTYALFQLSRCYSQQAGRIAHQVQQSADSEAPLHTMRGDILLRLQAKPEVAVAEYQQALTLDPNDPAILERLAEAQLGAGKTEDAQSSAQAALKIDPQRVGAKRTLAKIAIQERDYSTALPYLRELAARNPQDVTGKVELGKACAQTGALDEAFQNLAPALEHGYPDEKGTLHYLLGTVLKKMGRATDAEQAFATATQLSDAFQHKSYHDQDPDAQP
ncbi:MAG TPA: tetratricopeptide repeat protein [Candidatus Sulfotelmatobacter sp.]|nr:tetratricopeptide repeat protein [Candidatus Sulfotelmatobacter sp.]